MGAFLVGAAHGVGAACYGILSIKTKFNLKNWTRIQAGALLGTALINITRPYTQRWLDKKLTERYSGLIYDLTPLLAIGMATYNATKNKRGALLTSIYFAAVHKALNLIEHRRAKKQVWDEYEAKKIKEPSNYYEKLALRDGQNEHQKSQIEECIRLQSLSLIRQGKVQKGIKKYKGTLSWGRRMMKLFCDEQALLHAQLDYYLQYGKHSERH